MAETDPAGLTPADRNGWLDEDAAATAPDWLAPVVDVVRRVSPEDLSLFLPPSSGGRLGAVLMLFGEGPSGPDLLIIERSRDMRSHPGQPAFPGGAADDEDDHLVRTALREANEETGLDPDGVQVLGALPALWLPPSGFVVSPVIGWWRQPSPVSAHAPDEVASVHRVPWSELLDPARRVWVRHPMGYVGPGFQVRELLVWGFTGGLISQLFASAGLERPWEPAPTVDLPEWAT